MEADGKTWEGSGKGNQKRKYGCLDLTRDFCLSVKVCTPTERDLRSDPVSKKGNLVAISLFIGLDLPRHVSHGFRQPSSSRGKYRPL